MAFPQWFALHVFIHPLSYVTCAIRYYGSQDTRTVASYLKTIGDKKQNRCHSAATCWRATDPQKRSG